LFSNQLKGINMANLLSRVRGKTFYLLILSALFISGCSDDDDKEVAPTPVTNSAPVITSSDTDTAAAGTLFTYTLTASDADGDAITFRASLLPAWLTFNSTSGELSGTPARADAGDYEVTLAASDGVNSTPLFLNLSVVVVNAAPTITSIANNNGVVGASYSYTLTATDVDGDMLVKSAVSTLPSWASFDATTGTISGTPDAEGDVAVELSVSDGVLSTNQEFTLVITSVPSVVIGFDETVTFSDFGGAVTDVIANPDPTGINPSANVARMQKFAGEVFGGSTITFDTPFNLEANVQNRKRLSSASFSGKSIAANNIFQLKVWSQRQVALTFKLEGDVDANDVERVVSHDGTGWEVLSFDFTDISGTGYTGITLIFDNGVAGDAAEDAANWTFYFDDMVIPFVAIDDGGGSTQGPELVVNGGFDAGFASWNEIGLIVMEDGNNIFQADVQAAGNSFDVSLQQVLALEADKDYILTFRAKASVARGMIAGIGLNYDPWTNAAQDISLTTEWQTFTINLTTTGFGDANNRVFFDMGAEVGVVSIDDISLSLASVDGGAGGGGAEGPELAVNGGFDAGFASWNEIGLIVMENGNSIFQADVQAAGNSFDVSLQQVLALEADKDYILTFRAKASVARGMIAGIGLNYAPWTNAAQDVSMTTEWQTFTISLTTTGFGDANNRVFFDMGAEVGVVSIDDVSLKLAAVDDGAGGGDTGGQLTNNGDFEVGDLSGWDASENGGSITADNTQDSGSTWVGHIVAGPSNNPALSQAGLGVGTVMPGDTIDISFDMCGSLASGGIVFPALLSEFGSGTGADRQDLDTIVTPPSVWTRYNYSAVAGNNVTGGVSLQLDVVCGGDAACSADVYFDNVSVTIGGGAAPGAASGNSCVAGDTGGGDPGAGGGAEPGDEVAVNGGFENGFEGWNQVGNIVTEGDNSYLLVDVTAAGDPWSVNLSQVVTLVQDSNYLLSFKAKASVSRSITAGIGQNYDPFMSATENVALSTEWVTYNLNLTATGFGDANNRILFDMGAEVGAVSIDDISLTLVSSGGSGGGGTDPVEPLAVELVVFEDAALPEWAAWTDGRGTTEVLQDGDNGAVTKFTLTAPTVAGFTSRDGGGAVNGMTFDASALTNGIITFDFKMVKEPDAGLVDWKFKVESSTSTGAEVNLSASYEGHAAPALDTWQTYSFSISALADAGLDAANIDLFMVFPDYNSATGAEFYLDNFKITSGGDVPASVGSSSMSGGDLVIDVAAGIDFEGTEAEQASWDVFENVSNPALEFVANPSTVGNTTPQVAKITLETAATGSGKFAGAVTRTVQQFELNSSNAIVKIWVYKDKISPVGVKFEKFNGDGYGSHGELTVSNTKVNEWEQLTIDFTGEIGRPENDAITGIAIFPDMIDGRTATVAYFDEITFTAN
jgi:hypothetical protein